MKCLDAINRTCTQSSKYKAYLCVICNCFMIGTEQVYWLIEEQLQHNKLVLSVTYLESNTGKELPLNLLNQYKIEGNESFSYLILSP